MLPVRWLRTETDLRNPSTRDVKFEEFDCLVQFRINTIEPLLFNAITASELVFTQGQDAEGGLSESLLSCARRKTKTDRPDGGISLGTIVQVDAIYHSSFIAIPYQWNCLREQVLADEGYYRDLLETTPIRSILEGRTVFRGIEACRSSRIAMYANLNHCVWRVGRMNFHCEAWKRPQALQDTRYNRAREYQGWTEKVWDYQLPQEIPLNPEQTPQGEKIRPQKGWAHYFQRELWERDVADRM